MSWRARTCGHLYHGAGAPGGPRGPWERFDGDVPAVITPRAGHRSVDEEGVDRLRPLRVEDTVAELLGQDLGPPGVDQQRGIPDRQEANGGRGLRVGQRGIVRVQQATALLVPVLAKVEGR